MLDYETMLAKNQPFRGFFTLFWVTMAAGVLVTIIKNFSTHGTLVSLRLAVQMSKNGVELVASDIAMVASMFICIPIMKLIVAAPLPRFFVTATYLAYELVWLSLWVTWVVYNEWEWTQSGAFTMHIISMLMKQHSYLTYNTELAYKYKVYQAAITIAATSKKLDSQDEANSTTNLAELKHELVKETVSFPANLTLYKFADYVALPTLVYELEYPRTSSFRLWYFLERCLTTVTTISLAYIVMEHYIYPVLNLLPEQSVVESLVSLLIPCMLLWILLFYVIFECICNASAELTYFADRHFYADWWNVLIY